MINIEELEKSLTKYKQCKKKLYDANSVIKRIGEKGRLGQIGKFQNTYSNDIKVALQYTDGGTNYWGEHALNDAFNNAVKENFTMLLNSAIDSLKNDFHDAENEFIKYKEEK